MLEVEGMVLDTTVLEVLELLGGNGKFIKDIKPTGDNIMITCPFHKGGTESRPSCGVHATTGVAHCFTCGYTATLPQFIGDFYGKHQDNAYPFGIYWLKRNFVEYEVESRPELNLDFSRKLMSKTREVHTYVPDMVLDQYRYTHPYMYQRKLTDDVIEQFDVGYDKQTDCITFPVRDISGNCLFIARRATKTKWFNYPAGAHKPLYGVYEWSQAGKPSEVIVCESIFNCLTCWTHGYPAVALNGTGSSEQLDELRKLGVRSLVLCLDPDDAGRHGTQRIKNSCTNKVIYDVQYTDGRDLNDLSYDEFENLMKTKNICKRY